MEKLKDGIYYNDICHITSLDDDEKRLTLCDTKDLLQNPRYLFLSLRNKYDEIVFDILTESDEFKWDYIDSKYIANKNRFVGIRNDKLFFTNDNKFSWKVMDDKYLFNENSGMYISCNLEYKIELCLNKKYAIPFYFSDKGGIHYIKPKIRLDFDMNNLLYNIDINNIYNEIYPQSSLRGKNIGLLLLGGFGRRFDINVLKQLYLYNSVPLFVYSLKILVNTLDSVIIVVNSICYKEVFKIIENDNFLNKKEIYITINDFGDRLESIEAGLNFIQKYSIETISNIIIHDGSRPFIKEK